MVELVMVGKALEITIESEDVDEAWLAGVRERYGIQAIVVDIYGHVANGKGDLGLGA